MKRRKFLKFLGLSATIPLAVACKPKSKGTFEPYVPEEEPTKASGSIYQPLMENDNRWGLKVLTDVNVPEGEIWFINDKNIVLNKITNIGG